MKNIIQQLNYAERFGVLQNIKEQSKSYRSFNGKVNYLKIAILLVIVFINISFLKNLDFMLQLAIMGLIYTVVSYLINRFILAPRANIELHKILKKKLKNRK